MQLAIGSLIGLAVGAVIAWLLASRRASGAAATARELRAQVEKAARDFEKLRDTLSAEQAGKVQAETRLAEASKNLEDQKKLLEQARTRLTDTFKALSDDALKSNNQAFLELAKKSLENLLTEAKGDLGKRQEAIESLVKPLRESLKRYEEQVQALESSRQKAYGVLEEQLRGLASTHQQLQKETGNLVNALRAPQVRGRWGEMTLRRVVELAGMSNRCDFTEQVHVESEAGRLRPDMVVHLPGDRELVVDAKVSLDAYLQAISAEGEEERRSCLSRHARQIRTHMKQLAAKSYWDQFDRTPEFVVMFIPGESFFGAAVDNDQSLIEDGMKNGVVLATPTTLIALLRAVAYGWRQERLAENAQAISELGRQLYDRFRTFADHLADMGRGLEKASQAFNRAVGSMESRVFPAARRFRELGVGTGDDIKTVEPVETTLRHLNPPEAPE